MGNMNQSGIYINGDWEHKFCWMDSLKQPVGTNQPLDKKPNKKSKKDKQDSPSPKEKLKYSISSSEDESSEPSAPPLPNKIYPDPMEVQVMEYQQVVSEDPGFQRKYSKGSRAMKEAAASLSCVKDRHESSQNLLEMTDIDQKMNKKEKDN